MMNLLEGLPKTGKSHELVRITLESISLGLPVATTMTVNAELLKEKAMKKIAEPGEIFKIKRLSDIENFTRGVVIIDEAGSFIHARDWADMTPAMRSKFSEYRHDGLEVWLAAQEFETVDPIVRGLLNYCYRLEPFAILWWKGYVLIEYTPLGRKINRNREGKRKRHLLKKELYPCYNYMEHMRSGEHGMQTMQEFVLSRGITFEV